MKCLEKRNIRNNHISSHIFISALMLYDADLFLKPIHPRPKMRVNTQILKTIETRTRPRQNRETL